MIFVAWSGYPPNCAPRSTFFPKHLRQSAKKQAIIFRTFEGHRLMGGYHTAECDFSPVPNRAFRHPIESDRRNKYFVLKGDCHERSKHI
jgi:hypothetical protein